MDLNDGLNDSHQCGKSGAVDLLAKLAMDYGPSSSKVSPLAMVISDRWRCWCAAELRAVQRSPKARTSSSAERASKAASTPTAVKVVPRYMKRSGNSVSPVRMPAALPLETIRSMALSIWSNNCGCLS